tara:strand:+ start:6512 stop:6877 length:366 start_codon:yes stop_codon:yes gene_type:complete
MATFQKTVLTIAAVLLIIALIVFALLMGQSTKKYPPVTANCPDYWIDLSGGIESDGSSCYNVKNLGKAQCKKQMDFNSDFWTGDDGKCNKQTWAKACDLTWDGITNGSDFCAKDDDDDDTD